MTSYAWAVPGTKVICIWRQPWITRRRVNAAEYGIAVPEYRRIYTIRDVEMFDGGLGLRFVEIDNRGRTAREAAFMVERFRPFVTRTIEQDVAIFAPLLNTPEHADAGVAKHPIA